MHTFSAICLAYSLVDLTAAAEIRVQQHHAREEAFEHYQKRYGRSYAKDSAEYAHRFALYSQRATEAEAQNAKPGRLWTAHAGPLADRTETELAELRGYFGSASTRGHGNLRRGMFLTQMGRDELPEEFTNWTSLAAVTGRGRNQGGCGSCWAVATATVMESHAEIYNSPQKSFSPQELVSCVPNPQKCGGTGGCAGATTELAFDYIMSHGLRSESDDPYKGRDTPCPNKKASLLQQDFSSDLDIAAVGVHTASDQSSAGLALMGSWERLPMNKYEPLMRAVVERGPVAISVDATDFSLYQSGVFDGCKKDAIINHAVVLLGYGKDQDTGHGYWTIENSWGHDWGENGKIRILRQANEEELCGIDRQPQDGTACEGGPKQVEVCGACGILYDNVVPHFVKHS